MKKLSTFILALALLGPAGLARAATRLIKSSAPSTVSSTELKCDGTDSGSYSVFSAQNTYSRPYALHGAVATLTTYSTSGTASLSVVYQTAPSSTGPWTTQATKTDPDASGTNTGVILPYPIEFVRIGIPTGSYTSGSIYGCITARTVVQTNPLY